MTDRLSQHYVLFVEAHPGGCTPNGERSADVNARKNSLSGWEIFPRDCSCALHSLSIILSKLPVSYRTAALTKAIFRSLRHAQSESMIGWTVLH